MSETVEQLRREHGVDEAVTTLRMITQELKGRGIGSVMLLEEYIQALESELAETKRKLKSAEQRIRESQEQEPVLWQYKMLGQDGPISYWPGKDKAKNVTGEQQPLYATPPMQPTPIFHIDPSDLEFTSESKNVYVTKTPFDGCTLAVYSNQSIPNTESYLNEVRAKAFLSSQHQRAIVSGLLV